MSEGLGKGRGRGEEAQTRVRVQSFVLQSLRWLLGDKKPGASTPELSGLTVGDEFCSL